MRLRTLSIKNKLTLAFLLVVVPFLTLQLINVRDKYDERRLSVLQSQAATAQAIASAMDTLMVDALRTNEVAGLALTSKSFSADEVSQYLSLVRARYPAALYVAFLSPQGKTIAADPPSYRGEDFSQKGDVLTILKGRDWAPGDLEAGAGAESDVATFSVSVGIRIEGELQGIVRTTIRAQSIAEVLPKAVTEQSNAVVTDSQGRVVFDSLHPDLAWDKRDWSGLDAVQAALSQEVGLTDGFDSPSDGVRRLGSQVPVQSAGWAAGAYRKVDEAMAPVKASSIRDLIVLAVSLLVTISLVRALGIILTRPLQKLTAHAEKLGKGDLSQTIEISSRDETGQLALVFNQMSRNLAGTIGELTQAKEEISQKTRQLQQLLGRTNHLQEEERKRIAFDIHDGVLQMMTAADYETQAANRSLASNPGVAAQRLTTARQRINEAIAEMRRVIFDLYPTHLESSGLVPALQKYAARLEESTGLPCRVKANGPAFTVSDEVKGSVYRIVQEAAFNVVKHAGASRMEISVDTDSGCLLVSVEDDGHGFPSDNPPTDHTGHLGLISMVERAEGIGGHLRISSSESGTRVLLEVPIPTSSNGDERG